MDNEASTALKRILQKIRTVVQLAPLHSHRRNLAERAIRISKNSFLEGLASVDKKFTIYLWCHMVKQVEISVHKSSENLITTQRPWHHREQK